MCERLSQDHAYKHYSMNSLGVSYFTYLSCKNGMSFSSLYLASLEYITLSLKVKKENCRKIHVSCRTASERLRSWYETWSATTCNTKIRTALNMSSAAVMIIQEMWGDQRMTPTVLVMRWGKCNAGIWYAGVSPRDRADTEDRLSLTGFHEFSFGERWYASLRRIVIVIIEKSLKDDTTSYYNT